MARPAGLVRDAQQRRIAKTGDRYQNVLILVRNALHDVSNLTPQQIEQTLAHLVDWLGKDDPLGFLRSLQRGQLFQLLGEIAPVIAGWLADSVGVFAGGAQSKRGGYSRTRYIGGAPTLGQFILANAPQLIQTGIGIIGYQNPQGYSAAGPFPYPGSGYSAAGVPIGTPPPTTPPYYGGGGGGGGGYGGGAPTAPTFSGPPAAAPTSYGPSSTIDIGGSGAYYPCGGGEIPVGTPVAAPPLGGGPVGPVEIP